VLIEEFRVFQHRVVTCIREDNGIKIGVNVAVLLHLGGIKIAVDAANRDFDVI
jgi:hypothetical protein